MSDIRFNRWLHQSGTGGVYQDSSGRVGIGTSVPTSALDVQSGSIKIGSNTLSSSGVSTFTTVNATSISATNLVVSAGSTSIPSISPSGDSNTGIFFPSADTVAIGEGGTEVLRINSSGNLQLPTAGTKVLNSSGNPILHQTGSILQVVQTVKTNTFSTSSGTASPATITDFSASITPSSTSNKIFVHVHIGELSGNSDTTWGIFMFRNGTKIFSGDAAGSRALGTIAGGIPSTGGTWRGNPASILYLDSPSSTSSVTYTFALGSNSSSVVYFNRDGRDTDNGNDATRTASSIILMEVVG